MIDWKLFRYHSTDASTAYADYQAKLEAIKQAEEEAQSDSEYEYEYVYEGDGDYDEDQETNTGDCVPCDVTEEEESPRFFFNIIRQQKICCTDERQATTPPPTGPRMKNATRCGRKSYQRILGGVVTKENEFPWQCALLKPDMSYFGCSAVLLSCDPVIIISAAHCFQE